MISDSVPLYDVVADSFALCCWRRSSLMTAEAQTALKNAQASLAKATQEQKQADSKLAQARKAVKIAEDNKVKASKSLKDTDAKYQTYLKNKAVADKQAAKQAADKLKKQQEVDAANKKRAEDKAKKDFADRAAKIKQLRKQQMDLSAERRNLAMVSSPKVKSVDEKIEKLEVQIKQLTELQKLVKK